MAVQISGNDITVPRDGTFSRNVSIAGTLTYEDVTNIDSVGLVTARQGIEIGASPGVAASISVDGNAIFSGITTIGGNVKVGTGITISPDGDVFFTGIITGNGSGLTNAGPSLTGSTNNTVVTVTGANAIQGESGLTYNGTRLDVTTGDLQVIGGEGGNAEIRIVADQGDDGADYWRFQSAASDNKLKLASYTSGSWVDKVDVDTSGNLEVTGSVTDSIGELRAFPVTAYGSNVVVAGHHAGKTLTNTSGGWTINASTDFATGEVMRVVNKSGSSQSVFQGGSATVYSSRDSGTSGDHSIKARGSAIIICTGTDEYYVSGDI